MTVTGDMDPWMPTKEVADLFSVTVETVRNWISEGHFGEGNAIQINGYWRIKRSAVVAFASRKYGTG